MRHVAAAQSFVITRIHVAVREARGVLHNEMPALSDLDPLRPREAPIGGRDTNFALSQWNQRQFKIVSIRCPHYDEPESLAGIFRDHSDHASRPNG